MPPLRTAISTPSWQESAISTLAVVRISRLAPDRRRNPLSRFRRGPEPAILIPAVARIGRLALGRRQNLPFLSTDSKSVPLHSGPTPPTASNAIGVAWRRS